MPRSPDKRWPSPSEREDRNRDRRGPPPYGGGPPAPRYDSSRYGYRRDDRRDVRYDSRYDDDRSRRATWATRHGGERRNDYQDNYKPSYSREGKLVRDLNAIDPQY
jgi:hypothetical protein